MSIWEKYTWNFIIKTKISWCRDLHQQRDLSIQGMWWNFEMRGKHNVISTHLTLLFSFLNPITFFTVGTTLAFWENQRTPFKWYFNICRYQWVHSWCSFKKTIKMHIFATSNAYVGIKKKWIINSPLHFPHEIGDSSWMGCVIDL